VESVGPGVEVLATLPDDAPTGAGRPVVARQGAVLVAAFHPELTGDRRLHRTFASMVEGAGGRDAGPRDGSRPAPVAGS
jgi:5'-phosphate synthase pdxT subunit